MKKLSFFVIIALAFLPNMAPAQNFLPSDTVQLYPSHLPPLNEQPLIYEFGVGLGVPYGLFGMKGSIGTTHLSGDFGLGIIPLGWDVSASLGASVHFLGRYSAVNPRLTVLYTNTAAYNLLIKETNNYGSVSTDVVYKEAFPGYAIFGGVDFRLGDLSEFFISANIGMVTTFIGNDEAEKRYNTEKAKLHSQGYAICEETISYNTFPKFSLGISYIIGRTLEMRFK